MRVYICIHIHTRIHTHTYIHKYIHTYIKKTDKETEAMDLRDNTAASKKGLGKGMEREKQFNYVLISKAYIFLNR